MRRGERVAERVEIGVVAAALLSGCGMAGAVPRLVVGGALVRDVPPSVTGAGASTWAWSLGAGLEFVTDAGALAEARGAGRTPRPSPLEAMRPPSRCRPSPVCAWEAASRAAAWWRWRRVLDLAGAR